MYCPVCGKEIEDNAVFCSSCGNRITENEPVERKVTPAAAKKKKNGKPIKELLLALGAVAVVVIITVLVGSAVSSARPENIAKDYVENYYNGEIEKADADCFITMRDQWELFVDKYHNGNKKAFFLSLSASYNRTVSSYSGAYRALDEMNKEKNNDIYGKGYVVNIGKCEEKKLSDDEKNVYISNICSSEFVGRAIDPAEFSGEIIKYRISYVIDGDKDGADGYVNMILFRCKGKWKVLNPMIFGWQ